MECRKDPPCSYLVITEAMNDNMGATKPLNATHVFYAQTLWEWMLHYGTVVNEASLKIIFI